ncbi:MAG: CoA transferase, partial [Tardiphaga sp.]|nr:CoA transferase [Tardiphaga sp.]
FGDNESFSRREDITKLVTERLRQHTTAEWLPMLEAGRIWHAPVQDYADVQADPQIQHLGTFRTVDSAQGAPVTLVMHPARYNGETVDIRLMPQQLGAQTREVLAEAGYDAAEIDALIATKAVGALP